MNDTQEDIRYRQNLENAIKAKKEEVRIVQDELKDLENSLKEWDRSIEARNQPDLFDNNP